MLEGEFRLPERILLSSPSSSILPPLQPQRIPQLRVNKNLPIYVWDDTNHDWYVMCSIFLPFTLSLQTSQQPDELYYWSCPIPK
jgi:hypothetical protein